MIDVRAKRSMRLNDKDYAKGDKVPMPLQQFNDLERTGLVERAPAEVVEHHDIAIGKTTRAKGAAKAKPSATAD